MTATSLRSAVDELVDRDQYLAGIVDRYGYPPMWARPAGFASLVKFILEQQVSLASAAAAFTKLQRLGRVTPAQFLEHDDRALRDAGFSRQKTRYCRALASALVGRSLDLRAINGAPAETIRTSLKTIPGIGDWTVDVYLLMALRRPDVWPVGDLALRRSVEVVTRRRRPLTEERLQQMSRAWRPWRSVAARLFWHDYLQSRRSR